MTPPIPKDGSILHLMSQKTWVQNTLYMNPSRRVKIGPKLEDWFLKLGGVFVLVKTVEIR
jgi:hypothetical protein